MGPLGVPELIILSIILVPVLVGVWFVVTLPRLIRRRAKRFGYTSSRAYLRGVPQSDAEKRDAVDLAMKGLVLCILGLLFPPVILAGLIPLFYGARKLMFASMGLGLVDDPELPTA